MTLLFFLLSTGAIFAICAWFHDWKKEASLEGCPVVGCADYIGFGWITAADENYNSRTWYITLAYPKRYRRRQAPHGSAGHLLQNETRHKKCSPVWCRSGSRSACRVEIAIPSIRASYAYQTLLSMRPEAPCTHGAEKARVCSSVDWCRVRFVPYFHRKLS